jgi:hypothetical protein
MRNCSPHLIAATRDVGVGSRGDISARPTQNRRVANFIRLS